jgi:shikimate kinase
MNENRNLNNIYLIGFMGAGKTSVGRILAKSLRMGFVDIDDRIEKELGMTISQIFSKRGEDYFRDAESKMLKTVSQKNGQVIATGGGIVLRDENWEIMKKNGVTVYLRASIEVLWARIKSNTTRPLLQVEDPLKKAVELLSIRIPLYEKADLIIDSDNVSPHEVASDTTEKLKDFYFQDRN